MGSRPLGRDLHERKTEKAGLLFPACDAMRFMRQDPVIPGDPYNRPAHMWATNEVLRFAASIVVGLLAAVLLRGHRRDASALASVFLLVAAAAHLTFPLLLRSGVAAPMPSPSYVRR